MAYSRRALLERKMQMSEEHQYSKAEVRTREVMRRETHHRGKTWAPVQDATATACPNEVVSLISRPVDLMDISGKVDEQCKREL